MILDSNILIGYLNGDEGLIGQVNDWRISGYLLSISAVTVTEVLSLPKLSPEQIQDYQGFLRTFEVLHLNESLAERAGWLRRQYPAIAVTDAMIAATAISTWSPLVTRDDGFRKVTELELIVP